MKYQKDDLARFPGQIEFALANYQSHLLKAGNYQNIILAGLGGSGIAGRIAKSFFFDSSPAPIEVISDYTLPAYAGKHTLAIMSSYSGNTEETLSMYMAAKSCGCTIVAITTGGKLAELAKADGFLIYNAEKGFQPRMALGYSLTYLLLFFGELFGQDVKKSLQDTATELKDTQKFIDEGEKLMQSFRHVFPKKLIVVTDYASNAVGLRFCQQIQENAKAEAFLHELPEANHNVIESYYGQMDSIFLFLNSHINPRTKLRFQFLQQLLSRNSNLVLNMDINAKSISSLYKSIYILDWVSLWAADQKAVNSSKIENIIGLKDFLDKN